MEWIIILLFGGFALFCIIACSVKMAVKEALFDFKEDIVKEFNLKKIDNSDNNDG